MGGGGVGADRSRAEAVAEVVVSVVNAAAGYSGKVACAKLLNLVLEVISADEITV